MSWVQSSVLNMANNAIISSTDGTGVYFELGLGTSGNNNVPFFYRATSGGTTVCLTFALAIISAGTWNHIAATQAGTAVSIYVNGMLVAIDTAAGTPGTVGTNKATLAALSDTSHNVQGRMKNIAIYNTALTQTQIISAMTAKFGSPVAYYPCTDASGSSTILDTISGNNLTITSPGAMDGGVPYGPPI